MVGLGLSFLLVFRNNIAFNRFWNGRGIIGDILSSIRTTGSRMNYIRPLSYEHECAKRQIGTLLILFYELLRNTINRDCKDQMSEVHYLLGGLSAHETRDLEMTDRKAFLVLHWIRQSLCNLYNATCFDGHVMQLFEKDLRRLMNTSHEAITIATIAVPFPYLQLLNIALCCYCLVFPIVFVEEWGYFLVVPVFLLSGFLFGINDTAAEIEMPYRRRKLNALPIQTYGQELLIDLQLFSDKYAKRYYDRPPSSTDSIDYSVRENGNHHHCA